MLQVDLRDLARGPFETTGEIAGDDPLFEGLDVKLTYPVRVAGRMQEAGEGRFYWQGSLETVVTGECRRCLNPAVTTLRVEAGALFSQDPDAQDDPDAYAIPADAVAIDVSPVVREELLLAAPAFLLCREDCRGLCPRCGQDLNAGSCGCPPPTDLRWQGLAALKDLLSR